MDDVSIFLHFYFFYQLEGLNFNISLGGDSPTKSKKGAYIDKGSSQGLGVKSAEEEQSSFFSTFASILTGGSENKEAYQAPDSHLYSATNQQSYA